MADHIYGLPKEKPTPLPYLLQIGLDWQRFHTPFRAGGLEDQPIKLMRDVRAALNAYNAINAWRDAQHLSADNLAKFYGANNKLVKFMEYVWSLQNAADG